MTCTLRDSEFNAINVGDLRRKLCLNQQQFWTPIGVTQSGGSRYENERNNNSVGISPVR